MVIGTPWSGPQTLPLRERGVRRRARARRAPSTSVTTIALSCGL